MKVSKKIQIGVATQKNYEFPLDFSYLPIQTGASLSTTTLSIQRDDEGDNISHLNESFCELTALYWLWKNVKADYYGLCHYRRYFSPSDKKYINLKGKKILHPESINSIFSNYDLILPKKRSYYIETIYDHYKHGHSEDDLRLLEEILRNNFPDYLDSYKTVMNGRSISLYNMFIMKDHVFNQYCEWLFRILFLLENSIRDKSYGPYQKRVIGFLGERLLNVWVEKNKDKLNLYREKVINVEGENIINKGFYMILRKLGFARKD